MTLPFSKTTLIWPTGVREVGCRYQLDKSVVSRHHRRHLLPRLTVIETAAPVRLQTIEDHEANLDVMRAMRDLHRRTLALLDKAEASNDLHIALRAVREAGGNLELLGWLDGSLDRPVGPTCGDVNIQVTYVDKAVVLQGAGPRLLTDGE